MRHNLSVNRNARKRSLRVPSALYAPEVGYLKRYAAKGAPRPVLSGVLFPLRHVGLR